MGRITKWFSVSGLVFGVALALTGCSTGSKHLEQRKNAESYSLGYQTGMNMKTQELDIDLDDYESGIRDALAGKKSQLGADETRMAISDMTKRIQAEMKAKAAAVAERNLAAGRAFLEQNGTNEGIHILPSGLQYRILKEGRGKMPTASDVITVNYRSKLINGTEFASSYRDGKPTSTSLTHTIPGWREALQLMKEGSRWELFVPSELAYGQQGASGIAPNTVLVFDVELLSVAPAFAGNMK